MTKPTSPQVQEELEGRRGDLFTSRHPDILKEERWKTKEWFTIREVMFISQLNGIWVRTQVKDGRWKVKKDEKGRWLVSRQSLHSKLLQLHLKDERKRLGLKTEYKDPPPRIRSVKIIRKQVMVDSVLTKDEKDLILQTLGRYEDHFTRLYEERMIKMRNNKK